MAYDEVTAQLLRENEVLRAERDQARVGLDRAVKVLAGIHAGIYPQLHTVDGVTYRFTAPDPHLYLQSLADRIRAIPDEIAAPRIAGVTGLPAARTTRPAYPSEPDTKIARREGYDAGWNDCREAVAAGVLERLHPTNPPLSDARICQHATDWGIDDIRAVPFARAVLAEASYGVTPTDGGQR